VKASEISLSGGYCDRALLLTNDPFAGFSVAVRVSYSKLTNPRARKPSEIPARCRLNNGEKQLTGHFVADTRGRARATATENTTQATRPSAVAGTSLALIDNLPSATTTAAESRLQNRKIGQFRDGRRSTALTMKAIENILAAVALTEQQQRPLNRHTTIHFEAAGIDRPLIAIGQYLKLASDWLRTQRGEFAYIWVRESGERKGEHVHILMHVPARLVQQFAHREIGWRRRIGAKRALGAFKSTPVGRSYRHGEVKIQYGEHYIQHLAAIVGYLVKGSEPKAALALQLKRVADGGELWGKRTGMSENIGRAARARASLK
jgi:hypothetical protein